MQSANNYGNSTLQWLDGYDGFDRGNQNWSEFCEDVGTFTAKIVGVVTFYTLVQTPLILPNNPIATVAFHLGIPLIVGTSVGAFAANSLELVGTIARKTHATAVNLLSQ